MSDLLPGPFTAGQPTPALVDLLPPLLPPAGADPVEGIDVVILVDGLGSRLLAEHQGHARTLRRLGGSTVEGRAVCPSTTAASLATLMLGVPPLEHGILGYTVRDPATGRVVPQLTGAEGIDAPMWQPRPGLAELSERRAVHVSAAAHGDSFLSRAAYRAWGFVGHRSGEERLGAVLAAIRRAGPDGVVFVHVADVDRAGHRWGTRSSAWLEALEEADALIGVLLRRLPRGARVTVTADHGMVDADPGSAVDLADHAELGAHVAWAAGERRALMLGCAPGRSETAARTIEDRWGDRFVVLRRAELLDGGFLGPFDRVPSALTRERAGDLLVLSRGRASMTHTGLLPAHDHPEVGVHGSLTAEEAMIPVIRTVVG